MGSIICLLPSVCFDDFALPLRTSCQWHAGPNPTPPSAETCPHESPPDLLHLMTLLHFLPLESHPIHHFCFLALAEGFVPQLLDSSGLSFIGLHFYLTLHPHLIRPMNRANSKGSFPNIALLAVWRA